MLRGVDLLALRVEDVTDVAGQMLTSVPSDNARPGSHVGALRTCGEPVATVDYGLGEAPLALPLYRDTARPRRPITSNQYRRLIKGWATAAAERYAPLQYPLPAAHQSGVRVPALTQHWR